MFIVIFFGKFKLIVKLNVRSGIMIKCFIMFSVIFFGFWNILLKLDVDSVNFILNMIIFKSGMMYFLIYIKCSGNE